MPVKCFYDISNLSKYDKNEYPEFFARFYDLIYSKVETGIDESLYFKRISQTKGKILEAGVGTGRLFEKALKDGADIYGVDISPAMIDVLRKKLDDKDFSLLSNNKLLNCANIHKGLLPLIKKKLDDKGITKEFLFLDIKLIANKITDAATVESLNQVWTNFQ